MDLPVLPPLEPMLAKAQAKVPPEAGVWSYEPKWDGFRALVFRDGDKVVMQSRSGKELGRYFPELEEALRDELASRCVLDGEIVVPREIGGRIRLDWESLSQRIHPAASRVKMLAEQTPAHFIGFDALATSDQSLLKEPFRAGYPLVAYHHTSRLHGYAVLDFAVSVFSVDVVTKHIRGGSSDEGHRELGAAETQLIDRLSRRFPETIGRSLPCMAGPATETDWQVTRLL